MTPEEAHVIVAARRLYIALRGTALSLNDQQFQPMIDFSRACASLEVAERKGRAPEKSIVQRKLRLIK